MYFDELKRAMEWLAGHDDTIFLGQAVAVPGTAMSNTLTGVAQEKLIELPVAEEMQMGMSLGFALAGQVPISIYPRWNFLLLAMNQLINVAAKSHYMYGGAVKVPMVVRSIIGRSWGQGASDCRCWFWSADCRRIGETELGCWCRWHLMSPTLLSKCSV